MENIAIFEQIKSFIAEKCEIKEYILTKETSLKDIDIYGDDAAELVYLFAIKFNIDIDNIDLREYNLGPEPLDFITPILSFLKGESRNLKPSLTLGDLEKIVLRNFPHLA